LERYLDVASKTMQICQHVVMYTMLPRN